MPKKIIYGFIGLLLGVAIGFLAANRLNRDALTLTGPAPAFGPDGKPVVKIPAEAKPGLQADVAAMLERAQREPNNFAVQMEMGQLYARISDFKKAAEFYGRGVAANPQNIQANTVLANALFDSKQFEQAGEVYTRIVELDPKNVDARTDLAATWVERQEPNYERAIAELETALRINEKNEPTLYYLGVAYSRKGDADSANKALERLTSINPSSELVTKLKRNIATA